MKYRVGNPNCRSHRYYRDVTICDEWLTFEGFHADMGDRPVGMTLDRIDPYGGYNKDNCRWATASVQNRNKRK